MTWLLNWNVIHFVNKRIAKIVGCHYSYQRKQRFPKLFME